jgi:hypothetical protein
LFDGNLSAAASRTSADCTASSTATPAIMRRRVMDAKLRRR